ncbi:hypothetical protein RCL1_000348 [Eukaryota sp. TZLM3-RCL]
MPDLSTPAHQLLVIHELGDYVTAPVDIAGAEALGTFLYTEGPLFRLHCFISLFLSPRTKDETTALAMNNLHTFLPGGLTYESLIAVSEDKLDTLINKVGFHRTKARNLKTIATIFVDKYNSDIPDTYSELMALPGVGEKIALLVLSVAFNRVEGISVDTHVHKVANRLGWVSTKTPQQTRVKLENLLNVELWPLVNISLVRFGQAICKTSPCCESCPLASVCPSVVTKKKKNSK